MDEVIPIAPLTIGSSGQQLHATIGDVQHALRILTEDWPEDRGPRHRDAVETCLKVIDGHRSSAEARRALTEAAAEASLPLSDV